MASPWIERTTEGYIGRASVAGSILVDLDVPLPRENMYQELVDAGCHPRDVLEELDTADHFFHLGLNNERRYVVILQRRAASQELTPDDLVWIENEIRRDDSGFRRAGMIWLLGQAHARQYEELMANQLYMWRDFNDAKTALESLLDWGLGAKYETRIVELLRGVPEDPRFELQGWVFAILAWRMSREERGGVTPVPLARDTETRLFAEMTALAESLSLDDRRRFGTIANLATALGYNMRDSIDASPDDVLRKARERIVEDLSRN